MLALWKAEIFRGSSRWPGRPLPWAARLLGIDPRWGFRREFVNGIRDYTHGQEHHSRGVWLYFFLEPGLYETYRPISWRHDERKFWHVSIEGELSEIDKEKMAQCLRDDTLE
jgi:hypothetical protein